MVHSNKGKTVASAAIKAIKEQYRRGELSFAEYRAKAVEQHQIDELARCRSITETVDGVCSQCGDTASPDDEPFYNHVCGYGNDWGVLCRECLYEIEEYNIVRCPSCKEGAMTYTLIVNSGNVCNDCCNKS